MLRSVLWLTLDIALGIILAGILSPWAIEFVPAHYRGTLALGGLALASVVAVGMCRRVLGIGADDARR